MFIKIAAAYELLSDASKRKNYDSLKDEEAKARFAKDGGQNEPPPSDRQHGTVYYTVQLPLENIYSGAHAFVQIPVHLMCPVCGGSGIHRHSMLIGGEAPPLLFLSCF